MGVVLWVDALSVLFVSAVCWRFSDALPRDWNALLKPGMELKVAWIWEIRKLSYTPTSTHGGWPSSLPMPQDRHLSEGAAIERVVEQPKGCQTALMAQKEK